MSTVSILIADDHTLFRQGLTSLLEKQVYGIKVVGEAADGYEALEKVKTLKPDLVFLDIAMPGLSGLDVIPLIKKIDPRIKVLILSMYENEEYLYQSLRAGASGYVLKKAASSDLIASIKAALAGEVYLSPSMSSHVVHRYLMHEAQDAKDETDRSARHSLTNREREILRLLAQGKNNKEIARLLDISYRTVQTHRAKIMKKLNLHTLPHLVAFAMSSGIISPDELMSSSE